MVKGHVTDDELKSTSGVNISLSPAGQSADTDERGDYTLNGVPPGSYVVVAQRIGYDPAKKSVIVLAGQVNWANFTLKPLSTVFPYYDTYPRSAFIDVGEFTADIVLLKTLNMTCHNCKYPWYLGDDTWAMMTEYTFQPSIPYPSGYDKIGYHVYRNYTGDNPYANQVTCVVTGCKTYLYADSLGDHQNKTLVKADLLRPKDQITWYVTSGTGPNYQQKLYLWFSFAHHADLPDGWTAAPPK